jgi:N-acetylglucosamine-6-sulfatase
MSAPRTTLGLLLALPWLALSPALAASAPAVRPNVVVVLVDDLRFDEIDYPFVELPNIQRLAREGVRFRNAFVTTPLCSPSRASFLTGQYAHTHGVTDNTDRSPRSHELVTFPRLLHDAGYETAFLGKWHMGVDDSARPGFDHWISVKGQGRYLDPEFNVNGERKVVNGYFTDILNGFAVEFLQRPHSKPFLLYLAHKAVHPDLTQNADGSISDLNASSFVPAERHRALYANAAVPHRPNHGKPPAGKPALERRFPERPPLGPATGTSDETIRDRLRVLAAVDEGLGRMLRALEASGQLANTLVVFTSDEGYFYGEHGLSVERRLAYEESARIPLLMRLPSLAQAGRSIDELALNIDLAPTLLELCGAPKAQGMHGRSLVPLLRGERAPWRDSLLIEYFSDRVFPWVANMGYQAVRTRRYKYIHYVDLAGMDELYDLDADPYELVNLAGKEAGQPALLQLKPELQRLIDASR